MEEIVIWNSLTQWAFAQNPNIPKDVTKWSKEEITIMERTLHRYIPLIRFNYISAEDFHDKVYPLKEILPKDLINGLLTFYLVPNRELNFDKQPPRRTNSSKYDSVIIGSQYFALFASWIDKKNDSYYNSRNIPFNFNLLYRASRDGNTIAKFHEKTDNKGANIVVVKIKDSNQLVGGYNPLDWGRNGGYEIAPDSKIGRVIDTKNAVWSSNIFGPVFGLNTGISCDLMNYQDQWSSQTNSYPSLNLPQKFEIDDYEVFSIKQLKGNKEKI